jgi:hypothetical protein
MIFIEQLKKRASDRHCWSSTGSHELFILPKEHPNIDALRSGTNKKNIAMAVLSLHQIAAGEKTAIRNLSQEV